MNCWSWAIVAVEVYEAIYNLKYNKFIQVSLQELIDNLKPKDASKYD